MKKCLLLLALAGSMACCVVLEESVLTVAAKKGDLQGVKKAIEQGADVNEVVGEDYPHAGKPVLRYAIDSGSREAVGALIQAGAKVNVLTENGLIHKRGANVRNMPLLSSATKSRAPIGVIDELIAGGANVNQRAWNADWTPLMIAAYVGYTEAVKKLLAAGADKTLKNKKDGGRTALDYAKERKHKRIVRLLQDKK